MLIFHCLMNCIVLALLNEMPGLLDRPWEYVDMSYIRNIKPNTVVKGFFLFKWWISKNKKNISSIVHKKNFLSLKKKLVVNNKNRNIPCFTLLVELKLRDQVLKVLTVDIKIKVLWISGFFKEKSFDLSIVWCCVCRLVYRYLIYSGAGSLFVAWLKLLKYLSFNKVIKIFHQSSDKFIFWFLIK